MKEKERYELLNDNFIYDKKLKEYVGSPSASMRHYMETLTDLFNQQDEEIKDLQNDNEWLCDEHQKLRGYVDGLIKENLQLKQSQKNLL